MDSHENWYIFWSGEDGNIECQYPKPDDIVLKCTDAADHINSYYVNVGPNLAKTIQNTWMLKDNINIYEPFYFMP